MRSVPKLYVLAAAVAAGTLSLAACGGSSPSKSGSNAASKPVLGGTLRLVAASGPDHLDTVPAYYTADYILERAYTRQLLSYPFAAPTAIGDAAWKKSTTPVADAATAVPTTGNGGITNGGDTYTFHIRPGVMWNTKPARQVTSQDFLREYKAFFNPVTPVGNANYFTSTIKGLMAYDNAETAYFANSKAHPPTAANIAAFQNSHTISGISTPNSSTIVFTLTHPAADFIYMMAMPFDSARPVEYDSYVPDSAQFRTHTISDGPYQITSYVPGKSIVFSKNPAWKQSSDPIRHQYVSKITVTIGVPSAETQLADEKAGTYDLVEDTPFEPTAIPGLMASHDPKFRVWPWSDTFPYVTFNLRSPDAGGAMGKLGVRQAFEYGVSKVAVQKVYGGPQVAKIINTVIPPGNVGYVNSNLYPDSNGNGDTAKCKSTLAAAGYPHGVTLTALYINDTVNTHLFEAVQASVASCGIHLAGKPEPGSSYFVDLGNAPVNNKAGHWDVGFPGWIPDWFGDNGRTIISPFFQTDCVVNTINYGCVNSSAMNTLINKAESAATITAAGTLWHQADVLAMKNAWMVPLLDQLSPYYSSSRVHNAGSTAVAFEPNIGGPDVTNVWLNPNTP
jgi:peptide/nickel transport system substrate-binding protein